MPSVNPTFPFLRFQAVAQNQIDRYGRDGVLRRVGRAVDIPIRVAVIEFSPNEHQRLRTDPLDRKVLLAPNDTNGNLISEPSPDLDQLVLWKVDPATNQTAQPLAVDEYLSIVQIVGRINYNGTLLFWRLQVRR